MTNNSIRDEPAKLSPLSSDKTDKYEYFTSKVKIACESLILQMSSIARYQTERNCL